MTTNSDLEQLPGEPVFMTRTEMNRQFALSQAVAFHSGTPRNVTADNVVDMAKTFESYLNGDTDASVSK